MSSRRIFAETVEEYSPLQAFQQNMEELHRSLDQDEESFQRILDQARASTTPSKTPTKATRYTPQTRYTPSKLSSPLFSPVSENTVPADRDWKSTWDSMRRQLEEQDEAVRRLVHENDDLKRSAVYARQVEAENQQILRELKQIRGHVELLEQENRDLRRELQQSRDEAPPRGSYTPSVRFSDTRRAYTPPPSWKTRTTRHEYSPGTKIVAELAKMVDLNIGDHAPLSLMLDEEIERMAARR